MQRLRQCLAACRDRALADTLELAGTAALAAGGILSRLYGQPHQVTMKGRIDLVTEADLAAETAALEVIRRGDASSAILAEESAAAIDAGRPAWIVDPLDGTTNFAHHLPWFTVSIGFAAGDDCRVGVVYAPVVDEFFCAAAGQGAWKNGEPIRVSATGEVESALLVTGFPYFIQEDPDQVLAALRVLLTRSQGVRRSGAASLDLAYVACGRFDGFWELNLKPWDTAAGYCLVQEAGGRVSDYAGRPASPFVAETLASNGHIHGRLAALLAPFSTVD